MNPDPRCAPVVLHEDGSYRLVSQRKAHWLDKPDYIVEGRQRDAMGALYWYPVAIGDHRVLDWLKTVLGDFLHEAKRVDSRPG